MMIRPFPDHSTSGGFSHLVPVEQEPVGQRLGIAPVEVSHQLGRTALSRIGTTLVSRKAKLAGNGGLAVAIRISPSMPELSTISCEISSITIP